MAVSSRREKFLEESLKLIHEKGFKATTMRNIAERLNFDVANIYNYIDSKQSLLETFLFEISAAFHQGIDNIKASSYSPAEKLKAVIRLHIQLTAERPYEIALLVNEWRNLAEPKLSAFIKERDAYEAKVASVLIEGMDAGMFRQMDIEVMKYVFLSCVRWLFNTYTQADAKVNPIELEKQLTDFIFRGIGAA